MASYTLQQNHLFAVLNALPEKGKSALTLCLIYLALLLYLKGEYYEYQICSSLLRADAKFHIVHRHLLELAK